MNYRHEFHAGNHTEVFKHAVLSLLIEHMLQKPQPFAVLDTHAGAGIYDLTAEEAVRTGEFRNGVARIFGKKLNSAPAYSAALDAVNGPTLTCYPGSPQLIRTLLRPTDRLITCELHPSAAATLKAFYREDAQVSVHKRDGYEAMRALVPPPERRGVMFVDPPFENPHESQRMVQGLGSALKKWRTGLYAMWYPIKRRAIGDSLASAAISINAPKVLRCEFCPYEMDGVRLAGGGLLICNAPWLLKDRVAALCMELGPLLGARGNSWNVEWLTSDR